MTHDQPPAPATTANSYNVVNRLTDELFSGSVSKHYQYVYDGDGNRVQQFEDGVSTSYSYNSANEIQTAGTLSYTFDPNGNELGSTQSGSPILSFAYNAKNQPTNVTGTNASENMSYTGPSQAERLTLGNRDFNYTLLGMYSETVGAGGLTTFSQVSPNTSVPQGHLTTAGATSQPIQTVKQASTVQANTTFYYRDRSPRPHPDSKPGGQRHGRSQVLLHPRRQQLDSGAG